jgi:hypothetical protein
VDAWLRDVYSAADHHNPLRHRYRYQVYLENENARPSAFTLFWKYSMLLFKQQEYFGTA